MKWIYRAIVVKIVLFGIFFVPAIAQAAILYQNVDVSSNHTVVGAGTGSEFDVSGLPSSGVTDIWLYMSNNGNTGNTIFLDTTCSDGHHIVGFTEQSVAGWVHSTVAGGPIGFSSCSPFYIYSGGGGNTVVYGSGGSPFVFATVMSDDPTSFEPTNFTTRIISLSPDDRAVISIGGNATGTVNFAMHAYINANDIGKYLSIKIHFDNIDQNSLLSGACAFGDVAGLTCSNYTFSFFTGNATSSGDFYFASTTVLAQGNYRVEASLDTSTTFLGLNLGFFTFAGAISDIVDHQFVVGTSTFIGNISQNIFSDTNAFLNTLPATTTAAMAASCNPLGGNFGIRECMTFLLVPDAGQMNTALTAFRTQVLIKQPWGYLTRFVQILSTSATSSLPSISYTFDPAGPLGGDTWNIDMNSMVAGGGSLLNTITDPVNHQTIRTVAEPIVKFVVALMVIFAIVMDLTKVSHSLSAKKREQD